VARHSSPRRMAAKRRRMGAWENREARKGQAGRQHKQAMPPLPVQPQSRKQAAAEPEPADDDAQEVA
jgi:hypothetical protein